MTRLPQPGSDTGTWGTILNDYLSTTHNPDGTLKDNSVTNNTIAPGAVTKTAVGLSNVDNTSDTNKPISTATQTALNTKADTSALAAKLNTADLDAQVASRITASGSATEEALAGAIEDVAAAVGGASRYAGVGVTAIGDSITQNYGNSRSQMPDAYLTYALLDSGGRTPWRGVYATAGMTVEQIRDTHLPSVLAMDPLPAACVVLAGTNNTATSSSTLVHEEIYDALLAAGIRPIVATIPPRSGAGATIHRVNINKMNHSLREAAARRGLDLVDFHRAVTDPITGTWRTGYHMTDLIHPSYLGTRKMGAALADVLISSFPHGTPPIAMSADETGNLLGAWGMFLTDTSNANNNTASDGKADYWRSFSSALNTYSLADHDGSRWQKVVIPTTGGGTSLQYTGTPALTNVAAPGDLIEMAALLKTSGFEENFVPPSDATGGTGPGWSLLLEYQRVDSTWAALLRAPYGAHGNVDGALWARATLLPDANGTMRMSLYTVGVPTVSPCTFEVAQLAVRNLTALGLA